MSYLIRCVVAALVLVCVASVAQAQFPYITSFGQGKLGDPMDVAVYAPDDNPGTAYVFVVGTDTSGNDCIFRFPQMGFNSWMTKVWTKYFTTSLNAYGPLTGVAVNDIPGHCNHGQVYVCGAGGVLVFDVFGNSLMDLTWNDGGSSGFVDPTGIDVDDQGDVYVADRGRDRVVRFAWTDFYPSCGCSKFAAAKQVYTNSAPGKSLDVSVDVCGRLHVTHDCSCYFVFDENGSTWSGGGASGASVQPNLQGVTAKSPFAESWVTSNKVFHFAWDLLTGFWNQDYTTGTTQLVNPRGIEYQKFRKKPTGSMFSNVCFERLYVCDRGNSRIAVFGQHHLAYKQPMGAAAFWRFNEQHDACNASSVPVKDEYGVSTGSALGTIRPCYGVVKTALAFSGAGEGVRVANNPLIELAQQDFTIEGWIRSTSSVGRACVLEKRDALDFGYSVYLDSGYLGLRVNGGAGNFQEFAPWVPDNYVADCGWHHFVIEFVRSQNLIASWVDDQATGATAISPSIHSIGSFSDLYIGCGDPAWGEPGFVGALDELTIYHLPLAPPQITGIYDARCAGKRP